MKILFFGDIIGKIGRKAMQQVVPELKKQFQPDLTLANAENIAHGKGVNEKALGEMVAAGVDFFTSGNHIFAKPEAEQLLSKKDSVLLRPANFPEGVPGVGYKVIAGGSRSVLLINVLGQVFLKENLDSPFRTVDRILAQARLEKISAVIVDFHAEATSEKVAMGWYLDGRVSAVVGTHTHVPTADARLLPGGTAYVTDIGMVGAANSVIGVEREPIINNFLTQVPQAFSIPETGPVAVGVVLIEVDPATRQATRIERLDRVVEV